MIYPPVEKLVEYDFIVLISRSKRARWKRTPRFSIGSYLLDADTLLFMMIRGLKSSNRDQASRERAQKLVDRCRQAQAEGDTLAITVAEREFGARQSDRPDDELRAMRKVLSPFDRVAFDAVQAPAHYGDVRHDLESLGQPIGAMDLLLAAQALSITYTNTRYLRLLRE